MIVLAGHTGDKPVALLLNNLVLLPDGSLAALILGHCVFGRKGGVKGKYFNNTLYTLSGEMLGKSSNLPVSSPADLNNKQLEGWSIIERITDHSCPYITPLPHWSKQTVEEVMLG